MTELCPNCKTQLSAPWKFCPQCATAIAREAPKHTPLEVEPAPVKNSFAGLYFGLIAAPMLIILGGMLCLTGLGAFLGVPMIIAGIIAPLVGPILGLEAIRGKCPWCGAPASSLRSHQSFECDVCGGRIGIKDRKFVAVT